MFINKINIESKRLIEAFLVTAFFVTSIFYFFNIKFQTNDDIYINMIAKGDLHQSSPSEYLVFIHHYLGFALKQLYLWQPSFPFYGTMLFCLLAISVTFIYYSFLRFGMHRLTILAWLLGFAAFGLTNIQFTFVAFSLSGAGVLLWFSAIIKPLTSKNYWELFIIAISIMLVLIGIMVRFHAGMAALLLCCPAIMYVLWVRSYKLRDILALIAPILFTGICGIALHIHDLSYYKNSDGWQDYWRKYALKTQFIVNKEIPYSAANIETFNQVNWSENDLNAMNSWLYDDLPRYSVDNLEFIAKNVPDRELFKIEYLYKLLLSIILFIFPLYWMFKGASPTRKKSLVFMSAWGSVVLIIITALHRFPPLNVIVPFAMFYYMNLLCIKWAFLEKEPYSKSGRIFIIYLIAILTSIIFINSAEFEVKQTSYINDINNVLEKEPDASFIDWAGLTPLEYFVTPFNLENKHLDTKFIITGGWVDYTPIHREYIKKATDGGIYKTLCKENVFFAMTEDGAEMLSRYIEEHYYKVSLSKIHEGYNHRTTFYNIICEDK